MRKKLFNLIKLINLLFIFSYGLYFIHLKCDTSEVYAVKHNSNSTFNKIYKKMIYIPKIGLKQNIIKATESFSNLDNNLVYYKSLNTNNKIIIFGHSGIGYGTYFNRLDELDLSDILYFYNEKIEYTYEVIKIYKVDETKVDILDKEENSKKMLLITCDKNNNKKRLVVELLKKNVNSLKK